MRYLVTGGAGFVGSSFSVALRRDDPESEVIALDNLSRKGSNMNLPRLKKARVRFVCGDIRNFADIESIGPVDWLIDCSAEPSVHAGYGEDPSYLIQTNLFGAVNCLEFLRRHGGSLVFLSSSRVFPIAPLRNLPLERKGDRFVIRDGAEGTGWSRFGISETFPLVGTRSLYGATKFSAEILIAEYAAMYGVKAVVDRCGVLTGPWQMGKVDQGFVALWVARHFYGGPLQYSGFGGSGLQVRDILHVDDLYELVRMQMSDVDKFSGSVFNVGGGLALSLSLRELTAHCHALTGNTLDIGFSSDTRHADIPYFVTDSRRVMSLSEWRPRQDVATILNDIYLWLRENRAVLANAFTV